MGAARKEQRITQLQTNYVRQHEEMATIRKEKNKRVVRRLFFFGLLSLVIIGSGISVLTSQAKTISEKEQQLQLVVKQYEDLHTEEQMLLEQIVKLNDDEYIAKLARKEYFLSEENEIIFVLPDSDK